jgi:hypothetical protein
MRRSATSRNQRNGAKAQRRKYFQIPFHLFLASLRLCAFALKSVPDGDGSRIGRAALRKTAADGDGVARNGEAPSDEFSTGQDTPGKTDGISAKSALASGAKKPASGGKSEDDYR